MCTPIDKNSNVLIGISQSTTYVEAENKLTLKKNTSDWIYNETVCFFLRLFDDLCSLLSRTLVFRTQKRKRKCAKKKRRRRRSETKIAHCNQQQLDYLDIHNRHSPCDFFFNDQQYVTLNVFPFPYTPCRRRNEMKFFFKKTFIHYIQNNVIRKHWRCETT